MPRQPAHDDGLVDNEACSSGDGSGDGDEDEYDNEDDDEEIDAAPILLPSCAIELDESLGIQDTHSGTLALSTQRRRNAP